MLKKKTIGRPRGSKNRAKRAGFYKLSPHQIAEYFSDAPHILVSKDWLLNKIGDNKLFDAFFESPSVTEPESKWKLQEL